MRHQLSWATITLVCLACVWAAGAHAQAIQDPDAVIDRCDALFTGIGKSMRSIPQSTLQNWVRAQSACEALEAIASDTTRQRGHRLRARYVLAYGYRVLGLYDLANLLGTALVEDAIEHGGLDSATIADACGDIAQAAELLGRFDAAVAARRRALAIVGEGGAMTYNNLALALLKAGEYEECLKYVEKIGLDRETAHTRIFSARAHAYLGHFDSARTELAKACGAGERDGCNLLKALGRAREPAAFWSEDSADRRRRWAPSTLLGSSYAITASEWAAVDQSGAVRSECAPSFWFNEILPFYDFDVGALRYPPILPKGRASMMTVKGMPLLFALTENNASARDSVRAFAAAMHGPSAWDKEMPLRNRALIRSYDGGKRLVAVFVHSDEQDALVRRALAGRWDELK